ncbi:hypothetical protein FOTG_18862 [Fusarium oxysporum f. sp. vasinfectum 25433]|uniref:Uncharacterized protein n=1 Tax=Fusarium oxysporum f. sp. vasinfectum 25433 TaxID=1089449 RepID=X0KV28_FUSOX|nr:hypothetical protein FOTG_18862 [Fusarium oxysporum f. sp. vasinfectum 25433]
MNEKQSCHSRHKSPFPAFSSVSFLTTFITFTSWLIHPAF